VPVMLGLRGRRTGMGAHFPLLAYSLLRLKSVTRLSCRSSGKSTSRSPSTGHGACSFSTNQAFVLFVGESTLFSVLLLSSVGRNKVELRPVMMGVYMMVNNGTVAVV
jgi:hypothetical protein